MDAKIAALKRIRRALDGLLKACKTRRSTTPCPIWKASARATRYPVGSENVRIDFIFNADCPAASDAHANLRAPLISAKRAPRWIEWERSSPETPGWMCGFGSPTILVNRCDVGGSEAGGAPCCHVYQARPGRMAAVPPVELITAALLSFATNQMAPAPSRRGRAWR